MTMSTPSSSSSRSGEEPASAGWTRTGRRLAYNPRPPRREKRACSGRTVASGSDHFGPPTAPSRIASAAPQTARSSSRIGTPYVSIAIPPTRCSDHSIVKPNRSPVASTTRRAAATTSGPTPSPGIVATRYVVTPASPCRRSQQLSRQRLALPRRDERHRHSVDLGAVELVDRDEIGLERRLDDVRRQPVTGHDERARSFVG